MVFPHASMVSKNAVNEGARSSSSSGLLFRQAYLKYQNESKESLWRKSALTQRCRCAITVVPFWYWNQYALSMDDVAVERKSFYLRKSFVVIANFGLDVRSSSVVKTNFFLWLSRLICLFTSNQEVVSLLAYEFLIAIISVIFDIEKLFWYFETIINRSRVREKRWDAWLRKFLIRSYLTSVIIWLWRYSSHSNRYVFILGDSDDKFFSRLGAGKVVHVCRRKLGRIFRRCYGQWWRNE